MNLYSSAHKKFIPSDSVDIVSAENITPEGRHYIMYLRLKQDRIPVTLVPYDTQSAYHTFIVNRLPIDPETRLPLNPGFLNRIRLYKDAMDSLEGLDRPNLGDLFTAYLQGGVITDIDRLWLRSSLHLEDTQAIHEFNSTGFDIRSEAEAVLKERGNNSWLFRHTSIKNSSLIIAKCVSIFKNGVFTHVLICHVIGFGYYTCNIERGAILPGLAESEPKTEIPAFDYVFPCLIDLLEHLQKKYMFDMSLCHCHF
jgi:hypothetical protein